MSGKRKSPKYNFETQIYKSIPLRLIDRKDYKFKKSKRFAINNTNQNVWIPNKHLELDGTIKLNENIDYIFKRAEKKLKLASVQLHQ